MNNDHLKRRDFIKGGLSTLALSAFPAQMLLAQTPTPTPTPTPAPTPTNLRCEWSEFVQMNGGADYASFVEGVRVMRANTNEGDPMSWAYWANAHVNYCPHSIPYFFAWHRGYLYYFEQQLRLASGNSNLVLPYWDYYKNSRMPRVFTDVPSSPLYVPGRVNSVVQGALTLEPFSSQYVNFQRGTTNSYEAAFEGKPHNPIHNLIGGLMADMKSPTDPIFWLHHANVDRLWAAWVEAGGGRTMPASTASYWNGTFTYASGLTMSRRQTYTTTGLGYTYKDMTLPNAIVPYAQNNMHRGRVVRTQFDISSGKRLLKRPAHRTLILTSGRPTDAHRRSIGGARDFSLDENSISTKIPLQQGDRESLRTVLGSLGTSPFGTAKSVAGPYKSVQVVLDNLRVTESGKFGGYFYNVYLNLPDTVDAAVAEKRYFVGSFGAFEISGAKHHGSVAKLVLPATRMLAEIAPGSLNDLTVSIVRMNGDNSPRGPAIVVGEVRIELSGDELE